MTRKRIATLVVLTGLLLAVPLAPPASAEPQVPTYTVNSDTDAADANPGDGVCATAGGNCTLHAAIQEANLDGGASTIPFASQSIRAAVSRTRSLPSTRPLAATSRIQLPPCTCVGTGRTTAAMTPAGARQRLPATALTLRVPTPSGWLCRTPAA